MIQSGDKYTDTNSSMTQDSHLVNFYCNDSFNNINNSEEEYFFIDSIFPSITSLTESPDDPATYSSGQTYEFNATITDTNLDTILIEFDGTNYTPTNLSGNVYNFTIFDLAAGVYNYKWFANDTVDNINITAVQDYTINNATGDVTLLINGSASNQTATYETQTNASASTQFGSITLYRNGEIVTDENNDFVTLGVGYYNYTADSSGDQNHSSASITRFVNITQVGSEVNLTLNSTEGNITITQDSSIWLNGTLITGDATGTLRLYKDNSLINQGTTEVSNLTAFNDIGFFNITVFYIESQNYTGSFETWWVNVTEAPDLQNPSVTLLTESPSDPATYSSGQIYGFNATITDNRELDTVLLDFNGTNYTATNFTADIYNVTFTDLAVGTYNYRWYANDTSGKVNNTENRTYTINQRTPSLSLTITPSSSVDYETETTANGTGCPSQLICKLYRNDTGEITPPDVATLGVGAYNYTYNTTGNTNYTSTSVSNILIISQATGVVYTYLNNSRSNITINQYTSIWLNGTLVTGQAGDTIKLYYNDTLINQDPSPSNLTQFNNTGLHNITTIYDGNENYTSAYETWWVNVIEVDITKPNISIIYPQNNTNTTNANINVNYTVLDNQAVDSCWYSNKSGQYNYSITNCENLTTQTWDQGNNTVIIYVNDTSGNENSSSVTFFVDSIAPTIQFVSPTEESGSSIGENYIEINVTANDTNLETIIIRLYNSTHDEINSSTTISSPNNISFSDLSAGIYYYNATANDTLNNKNSTETRVINLTIPILTIHKPKNETYLANTSLLLNYSASYEDEVWYNINLEENTTINSSTYFNTSEGQRTLYLYANNSVGTTTKNVTFTVNLTKFNITHNNWKGANKGNSTNFNEYSYTEIQNLSNIILEHTSYGKIRFNQTINITNNTEADLDTNINISENKIELNSTSLPNFNKSATLWFYNLIFSNPRALRDEIVCPSTICTSPVYSSGAWMFNVTGFTVYSLEETPAGTPSPTPSGGRRRIVYECINNSDCEGDEICWDNKCVKLFDIKIIDFESPVKLGDFFDFTYFVKGVADINSDVEVRFWIEKNQEVITSGSDIIYFGSFEEKTETTKIFLPSNIESGIYTFFIQVAYGEYKATSHRVIEIEVKEEILTISPIETKKIGNYILIAVLILFVFILFIIFRLERKKIKKFLIKEEKWIKRHKSSFATFLLFVILIILAFYLNLFNLFAQFILKVGLWFKINVLPYLFEILKIIFILILLIILIITAKRRKWFENLREKIKREKINGIFKKKYKIGIKEAEGRIVKKIELLKLAKFMIDFFNKKINLFIKLIRKYKVVRKERVAKRRKEKRIRKKRRLEKKGKLQKIRNIEKRKKGRRKKRRLERKEGRRKERREHRKKRRLERKRKLARKKARKIKKRIGQAQKQRKKELVVKISRIFNKIKLKAKFMGKNLRKLLRKETQKISKIKPKLPEKEMIPSEFKIKDLIKRRKKRTKLLMIYLRKNANLFIKSIKKLKIKKREKIVKLAKKRKRHKKPKKKIKIQNIVNKYKIQIKKGTQFLVKIIKKLKKLKIKLPKIDIGKIKFRLKLPKKKGKPAIKVKKILKLKKLEIPPQLKLKKFLIKGKKVINKTGVTIRKITRYIKSKFKLSNEYISKEGKHISKEEKRALKNAKKQIKQIYKNVFKLLKKILRKSSKKKIIHGFETNLIKSGKFTQQHLKALENIISTKAEFKKKQLQTEFKKDKLNFQNKINKIKRNSVILINKLTRHLNDLISFKKRKRIKIKEPKKRAIEGQKLIKDFFSKGFTQKQIGKSEEQLVKEEIKKKVSEKPVEFKKIQTNQEIIEALVKKSEEKSPRKIKRIFKKPQKRPESDEEAIEEMFEEKQQKISKQDKIKPEKNKNLRRKPQEKTKEELDEILDKIERKETEKKK